MKNKNLSVGRFCVLDLFSGIGGISVGLERAGMKAVAFCEIEPACKTILNKYWPDIPVYDDVKKLTVKSLPKTINVICGGFPCQDISISGKGIGIKGARSGLWSEFARLIRELKPSYVVIENVPLLRSKGLNVVLGDLHRMGYDAEWHCIPAAALNARHLRDRIWIVAWPSRKNNHAPLPINVIPSGMWRFEPAIPRVLNYVEDENAWKNRVAALGNTVMPQIPYLLGLAIHKHAFLPRNRKVPKLDNAEYVDVKTADKFAWRSGKMIKGQCKEIPALCEVKQEIRIPTPTTSDATSGRALGKSKFCVKTNGQILKINPNGIGWSLTLSHWLRFNPTPVHKPNADVGDYVRPLNYGYINPAWLEWLMGYKENWTHH